MANIAKGVQAFTKLSIKVAAAVKSGAQAIIAKSKAKQSAAKKTTAAEVARKKAEAEARMLAQSKQKAAEAAAKAKAQAAAKAKTATSSTSAKKTTQTTTNAAKTGVVLLQWHDVQFYAKSNQIRGLKSFTVSSSVETEDEEIGNEKITKLKKKKGYTSSITAYFDIRLGISNVKAEAMKLLAYGTGGQTGYLSCCGAKLIPTIQMMKDAKVQNVVFAPDGRWISCEVVMNFVNRSKLDGTTTSAPAASGGGGGGGGGSSGSSSSGGGNSTYTVQISGMSQLKISAGSALAAAVKAAGSNYTGYITVNGKSYYLNKGQFGTAPGSSTVKTSSTPTATQAKNVAATVQKAAQKVSSTVKAVVSTVTKAVPVVSKIVSTVKSVASKIGSLFKKK